MAVQTLSPQPFYRSLLRGRDGLVAGQIGVRTRSIALHVLTALLALLAIGLWCYLIAHVVDTWDGDTADRREDVVAYYAAGRLVSEGRAVDLYDPDVLAETEHFVLGRPAGWHNGLAYLNPPFVAALFQPLTHLPYGAAQALWFALGALAVAISLVLLWPELRRLPRRWAAVFVLASFASFPVFWSLLYGQISSLVLLSWVLCYRWLKDGRELPAGLALALVLIKPQLAVVPVLYLVTTGRWRALAGFALGAIVLVGISVALVGPQTALVSYPMFLVESLRWSDEYGVDRTHMFGWSSFFGWALPGASTTGLLYLTGVASALTLFAAMFVWRRHQRLGIGAMTVFSLAAATILVSPHLHAQDLQILLVPAALLIAHRRDAFALAVPALLFLLMPLALASVNLVTPALAVALGIITLSAAGVRIRPLKGAPSWPHDRRVALSTQASLLPVGGRTTTPPVSRSRVAWCRVRSNLSEHARDLPRLTLHR
ncbi:MAG: glycosyltransferase family 87 protein [Dehalococcoidia bacterium]